MSVLETINELITAAYDSGYYSASNQPEFADEAIERRRNALVNLLNQIDMLKRASRSFESDKSEA